MQSIFGVYEGEIKPNKTIEAAIRLESGVKFFDKTFF